MEDLQDKIIELMDLFDGEVTTADKIERPQRALDREAIDDFMKRNPMAGGGMLVQPSADGSRPGYRKDGFNKMNLERRLKAYNELKKTYGKKTIEDAFKKDYGTSFENIADKREYKGRTVTNIIDGFKKKIKGVNRSSATSPIYNEKTGHIYKTSNRFGTFYSKNPGKNQFSGKLLTENTELINNIKKDAETMSQIEVEKKYKINKKTLKKIKDQEGIEFRKSYKAVPKKSIPYADRFTAAEKSAMYEKRKATETEEDRIKARERRKKYEDKVYKEYKMEPSSRSSYDDLWKDIARSANEGDRIKLIEGPKYSSGASYEDFKSRVFLDTKTNETFTYDTLKQYLNSGKLEGVNYNSVIEPYDLKNKIANSGLKEEIQQAYFGDKYKPPKRLRSQNTFHVHHIGGVAADPFSVQLTFHDQNLGLVSNKKFNKEWAKLIERNAPLSERKAYLKFVKSKTGENIAQTLEFPEVGKTRTYGEIGTDMQKLLSDDRFKQIKGLVPFMKELGIACKLSDGVNCMNPQAYTKSLNELSVKAAQGDVAAVSKLKNFTSKVATTGKFLKSALGPLAVATEFALEGGIALNKTLSEGIPFKQAFADSYINKYLLGPKTQIDKEAEIAKEMAKGEEFAMAKRGERMMLPQSATADAQRLKKREEEMKALYPQLDMVNLSNKEIDELLSAQGVYSPFTLGFGMQQRQPGIGDMRYNEDVAYDEIRDIFNKGAEEDIRRQQMQSIADAGGVANLAKGGRAGFSKGSLRKGVLSLIDDSLKKTPKDTTTELDKLIKKTLDEDLFDKKDRIVDSINISEAKKRKNYPYNMRVFEEPKNLDFYRAIKESNFRTKTGPFFDRIKKAGGGILKEAGDSSGAPPESGPNSQGLQGLLNRVKKT